MTTPLPNPTPGQITGLNGFDWLLVVVLAWSTLTALFRGLIREAFGLAGTVLGLLLALWNYPALAARLLRWITSPPAASITAFFLIAVAVAVVFNLLGRIVRGTAQTVGLGFVDRIAGAGFGLLRGALVCIGLTVAATAFLSPPTPIQNSRLAPYFLGAAREVSFVVPQDLQKRIVSGIDKLRRVATP